MMRDILKAAADEAYADHLGAERPSRDVHPGFEAWLVAMRAMAVLAAGLLAVGLATFV